MDLIKLEDFESKDGYSIDDILQNYFLDNGLVTRKQMLQCRMDCKISEQPLGKTLVNYSYITQAQLIDSMLEISPNGLEHEELVLNHVPSDILIETKTKIAAETINDIYLATHGEPELVKFVLEDYFPNQNINFIECSLESIDRYLEKLTIDDEENEMTLEKLLRDCVTKNVSDIHINPKRESYSVLVRIFGVRELYHEGTTDEYQVLISRIKDKSKLDMAERRKPQDGGFNFEHDGRLIDLRVSTVVSTAGEAIVIRILDPRNADRKLEQLGIERVDEWRKGASNHNGICLICGGTGSGKTTTLNSTLKELDKIGKAIFTAEDPVEYQIPGIIQCNMNESVGYDYARALKSFMRSDPDIMIVGEIRDENTARNAVKAAETGHLVFATIHTNTILGAFARFRDIGVPAHELKDILRSVLCQTLVRTRCKGCDGQGCLKCFGAGYSGRAIVSECHYFADKTEVDYVIKHEKPLWETILSNAYHKLEIEVTKYEELDRVFGEKALQILKYEIMRKLHDHFFDTDEFERGDLSSSQDLLKKLESVSGWKDVFNDIIAGVQDDSIRIKQIDNIIKESL